ncbi:hypothetical protein C8Q70DRAFT_6621 [Cubamyces menziesii]|nr:hypothetical protein C8Q70DRAFT_6621 [Cubamyces menziesii]
MLPAGIVEQLLHVICCAHMRPQSVRFASETDVQISSLVGESRKRLSQLRRFKRSAILGTRIYRLRLRPRPHKGSMCGLQTSSANANANANGFLEHLAANDQRTGFHAHKRERVLLRQAGKCRRERGNTRDNLRARSTGHRSIQQKHIRRDARPSPRCLLGKIFRGPQRIPGNYGLLSAPNRCPRWRASGACHRSDRPSHPVDGRPYACRDHPCDGHNKGQGLFGHHIRLVDHRTLQAFYHQHPSGEVETLRDPRSSL